MQPTTTIATTNQRQCISRFLESLYFHVLADPKPNPRPTIGSGATNPISVTNYHNGTVSTPEVRPHGAANRVGFRSFAAGHARRVPLHFDRLPPPPGLLSITNCW